jgi:hypothetical protein
MSAAFAALMRLSNPSFRRIGDADIQSEIDKECAMLSAIANTQVAQ